MENTQKTEIIAITKRQVSIVFLFGFLIIQLVIIMMLRSEIWERWHIALPPEK